MFDEYMTLYNGFTQYAPVMIIVCVVIIVANNIHLRMTLRQMHKQHKAIADARLKYARELAELRRAQHMQNM
jgi:predicted secreted Zn-dependent protease